MEESNQNGGISFVELRQVFICLISGHCIVCLQIKETVCDVSTLLVAE
jgi:hypothetical protein